jgi:signal transduction histidine kinase
VEVQLAVFVSDKVPEIVVGDPGRFRQIITNLVGNSVKVSVLLEFCYTVQPTRVYLYDFLLVHLSISQQ